MALGAETLGEAFQEIRSRARAEGESRPISRYRLGKILETSPSNIYRIETQGQVPAEELLRDLVDALPDLVDLDELLDLREKAAANKDPRARRKSRPKSARRRRSAPPPSAGEEALSSAGGTTPEGRGQESATKRGKGGAPKAASPASGSEKPKAGSRTGTTPQKSKARSAGGKTSRETKDKREGGGDSASPKTAADAGGKGTVPQDPEKAGSQPSPSEKDRGKDQGVGVGSDRPGEGAGAVAERNGAVDSTPLARDPDGGPDTSAVARSKPSSEEGPALPAGLADRFPVRTSTPSAPKHSELSGVSPDAKGRLLSTLAFLPQVATYGGVLRERCDENDSFVSPSDRFLVSVSILLGEVDRLADGTSMKVVDLQAAVSGAIDALWRLMLRSVSGGDPEVALHSVPSEEMEQLEQLLGFAPERREAYERLSTVLPRVLRGERAEEEGDDGEFERHVRSVILRALAVGARG